jgi:hypothetical protein
MAAEAWLTYIEVIVTICAHHCADESFLPTSLFFFHRPSPWRFNLCSLFIATTFLAVVLGMIAWLDRAWIGQ